jgi:FMN phosphatase YigB (HAD superfamily)
MLKHVFFDLYGTLVDVVTCEDAPETAAKFETFVAARFGPVAAQREREHPFILDLRAIRPPPVLHA